MTLIHQNNLDVLLQIRDEIDILAVHHTFITSIQDGNMLPELFSSV
ncbi:MAG: hypothetical protein QNJ18_03500 [Xenococcaceae cyanobacterium MO_167.B52]|nr:hypothetical protein [Xenococcaceae cyanobacterium MO_167.B52]